MHDQQQPKGWTPIEDARAGAAWFMLAAQVVAAPVEVMIRTRFGRNYFGIPSFLALFAVPMWMLFWPEEDPRPIFAFWALFILFQLRARVECLWLNRRGPVAHSRYNGWPRLAVLLRKVREEKIKGIEPFLVMAAGLFLLDVSQPLGSYVITAGLGLLCCAAAIESAERARAAQLHDAWIEQQQLAERFRGMMGEDRWQ